MGRSPRAPLVRAVTTTLLMGGALVRPGAAAGIQSEPAARTAVARAAQSYDARRYETSRRQFERAVEQARTAHDVPAEALARRGLGLALIKQGRYEDARGALQAALELFDALGDHSAAGWTLHHLGWLAFDYDSDENPDAYWTRGLAKVQTAGDRAGEAQLLSNRAAALPPGPDSVAAFGRALQLARDAGATQTAGETLLWIGKHQFWTGSYAAAVETFQQALGTFERIGAKDWEADVFVELGRLHELHGRRDRAGPFYRRGLAIMQQLRDKPRTAQALGAIVNMHRAAGQLLQAVAAARQVLALRLTMGGTRAINMERLRLAWLYVDLGRPRDAKPLIDAVVRGPNTFSRNLAYAPLAETYLGLGDYVRAHEAADAALRVVRETAERPFLLATRARAAEKLGDRAGALADVDTALGLVEDARTRLVPSDLMKQGYGERLQRLFALAVDLRMRSGRAEAALEATEQARARAFLDLLAARGGLPAAAGAGGEVRSAASATPASINQLAATTRRLGSVIVSYWVAPAKTYIWFVDPEGRVSSVSVPVSARRLAALIGQTSAEIGVAAHPPTAVWRELHEWLVRPIQQFLPDNRGTLLTIVPHGPLFRLSFAALLDRRHTYLIERFRLHYVPSGGSLLYLEPRRAARDGHARYLFVADPSGRVAAATAATPRLPGALREVSAIAETLPRDRTTRLTGPRATEERLRLLLAGQTVIHLATHGRLSDVPGAESFLTLSGNGTTTANDGRLTTEEIYELRLDADLVVLSACKSARGPVTGDGVLGMTRAFLYAGAPSIVVTLWDVADRSGAELMPAFYRHWRHGSDKSAALREAQLEMIARLRAGRLTVDTPGGARALPEHPFLWAAFILVGEL